MFSHQYACWISLYVPDCPRCLANGELWYRCRMWSLIEGMSGTYTWLLWKGIPSETTTFSGIRWFPSLQMSSRMCLSKGISWPDVSATCLKRCISFPNPSGGSSSSISLIVNRGWGSSLGESVGVSSSCCDRVLAAPFLCPGQYVMV